MPTLVFICYNSKKKKKRKERKKHSCQVYVSFHGSSTYRISLNPHSRAARQRHPLSGLGGRPGEGKCPPARPHPTGRVCLQSTLFTLPAASLPPAGASGAELRSPLLFQRLERRFLLFVYSLIFNPHLRISFY